MKEEKASCLWRCRVILVTVSEALSRVWSTILSLSESGVGIGLDTPAECCGCGEDDPKENDGGDILNEEVRGYAQVVTYVVDGMR